MLKSKLYHKLVVAGIAGTLIVSSGVVAFATTNKSNTTTKAAIEGKFDGCTKGDRKGDKKGFMPNCDFKQCNPIVDILKTEVTNGVITQAEADSAIAFLKTKEDSEKAKRDAEKAKYDAMTKEEKAADQAAKKATRDAQKAKLEAMTDAERKAYMEANKPVKDDLLAALVTAGIFTQSQADKIQASMPKRPEMGKERGKQQGGPAMKGSKSAGSKGMITE